jgi:hypothetical protein
MNISRYNNSHGFSIFSDFTPRLKFYGPGLRLDLPARGRKEVFAFVIFGFAWPWFPRKVTGLRLMVLLCKRDFLFFGPPGVGPVCPGVPVLTPYFSSTVLI